jgi:stalled ribosome rescue protein Dom34
MNAEDILNGVIIAIEHDDDLYSMKVGLVNGDIVTISTRKHWDFEPYMEINR